jgi:pilus assembly protein Flp/PilA
MVVRLGSFSAKHNERGATAVEYGLMVALVAAVIVIAVIALGQTVLQLFSSVPGF